MALSLLPLWPSKIPSMNNHSINTRDLNIYYCVCMYRHAHGRSEDNFQELVLSSTTVGSRDQIQVPSLGWQVLLCTEPPAGPELNNLTKSNVQDDGFIWLTIRDYSLSPRGNLGMNSSSYSLHTDEQEQRSEWILACLLFCLIQFRAPNQGLVAPLKGWDSL